MATTYLTRTMTGSPTSNQKGTMSYWVKRSKLGVYQFLGQIGAANAGTHGADFNTDDQLTFYWEHDGSAWDMLKTNRVFRDTNSWYHILWNWDSTLAASGDRLQLWVNGVRETDFATETQPAQDATCLIGSAQAYTFNAWSTADYFDGLISYAYYIDGTAYPASTFGEVDSDTGEWKIITSPSVTYGNQGYLILKDGNTITDQGSNSNDWTLGGGTLTDLQDCPSDVFATWNPLKSWNDSGTLRQPTYSNGNTTAIFDDSGNNEQAFSTLAVSTGKFYSEVKCTSITANANTRIGIGDINYTGTSNPNLQSTTIYYLADGNKRIGSSSSSYGNTYTTGDIISVAMDLDNNKLYFAKNGTWENSGDPTSGATGTGAIDITDGYNYCFQIEDYASSGNRSMDTNFGNGYFGTSAISSEGTNASEIGKFEYDVPTGYTALSTKGLNS